MKEVVFVIVCFVAKISLIGLTLSFEHHCPALCRCEIRPWFSPNAVYVEATTVDCNDLGLSFLPDGLPLETQVLLLQTNDIANVDTLDYLENITEIDLSQNNITSLRDVHLGSLPQLLSLHLEENLIQELGGNCLPTLSNLQEFYINHNFIFTINSDAFLGLDRLVRLHLNSNRLKTINGQWFRHLPSLEILMLGENPILELSDENFKLLANLRSLVLARMNLTDVAENVLVGLDNMESISFFDNLLTRVPCAALNKAKNLKFLDLNKNPIERIQRGDFMDMVHLKELGINSMPELISIDSFALNNLPELTKIEATNNPKLSYIHPKAFNKLPKLETLMLNSNALSALHRSNIESLPNLREVSLHSNPIRCDCVIRWVNTNDSAVRFMEPDSLFCVDPPEYQGQHVRQVHFREMTETCLPLISPGSLPNQIEISKGGSVSLHCRAFGEPEPEIYWVTPLGDRIIPGSISEKYYMHPEGTFDIYDATEIESGSYTCVAHNLVGADLKTVTISVDGFIARPQSQPVRAYVTSIQARSVAISWESASGLLSRLTWTILSDSARLSMPFVARLPTDVKEYRIRQLKPGTRYQICVEVVATQPEFGKDCVNVTTEELPRSKAKSATRDGLIMATCAVLFVVVAVACSVTYTSMSARVFYRQLIEEPDKTLLIQSDCSLFLQFSAPGGAKVKATVIDLSNDTL
ncbi:leucine-rich repeat neuronal protein 3-like [Eucyclogobius newberryi]|uniref:leucine-rich repeat neuronal protein 3-like n=1 Tax=Eucyclogobius newberryi TaxID=166745 RepID=UPI003B595ED3